MNRKQRATIAKQTLVIIESGKYISACNNRVFIRNEIQKCIAETLHYAPDDFDDVADRCARALKEKSFRTRIRVVNSTTFAAARELTLRATPDSSTEGLPDAGVLCLNFASAKNPGGGFLGGSQAQEECLARSSALYGSINPVQSDYEANRRCGTPLYTEHMIYSPSVPVFRGDDDRLMSQPWSTSIVTSPAVNRGAIEKGNHSELAKVSPTMRQRIANLLSVAVVNGCRSIVLGAWGCGVFRNDPATMAGWFARHLTDSGLFENAFEEVVFAVWDKGEKKRFIKPFQTQFQSRQN